MVIARLVAIAALAGACTSAELAPARIRARTGPAAERTLTRVVAVPATCGTLSLKPVTESAGEGVSRTVLVPHECEPQAVAGADIAVRAALEFRGMQLIDSDSVNAVTAKRTTSIVSGRYRTDTTSVATGARFEDATPAEQAAILDELGADGLLHTRIWVSSDLGGSQRRTIIVQVRLIARDGALAWARRCELEVGGLFTTDQVAMERGARCAAEGERP